MNEPREVWRLDTECVGHRVLAYDEVDSTNTTAAALAGTEFDRDGVAVVAFFQRLGRGQHGRVWQARPGRSLLMSVVLHPPQELRRPVILTALTAVAVADAVYALTGTQARLKWPNDLTIRGKKVCGLLIEQHGNRVVVGIGLNLNQTSGEFADAGLPDAVSLAMLGEPASPRGAAEAVLGRLDREYTRLLAGETIVLEADWKWRVGLLGRHVVAEQTDGSSTTGRLHEMGFDGLELDVADGFFRVVAPESIVQLRAL